MLTKRILMFESPCYLSLRQKQLEIQFPKESGRESRSVPIEDVGVIVLDNPRITITLAALAELCGGNVAVITCNGAHVPAGLTLPISGNTLQSKIFRAQAEISLPKKKQLWKQTVFAKIKNQKRLLELENRNTGMMDVLLSKIKSGDSENCEGQAAAFYWKNIFQKFPKFVRSRDGAPPNNLLNYGYSILRAGVARAIVASGLHPTLGIFHRNQYSSYCLADDLMEPYRPFVDKASLDIISKNDDLSELTTQMKGRLLGIFTDDVLMNGSRSPLMSAVVQTARSMVKFVLDDSNQVLAFPEIPTYATL